MIHKQTILVLAFLMLIGMSSATIIPPDDYDYKGVFSIWNVKELNATGNITADRFVVGPYSYINYNSSNLYSDKAISIYSNQSADLYLSGDGSFIIYNSEAISNPPFPMFTFSIETGYIYTFSGSSDEWDDAYGWGNHASAGYLLNTGNLNRSQVINNWAACPTGSAQISDNETGRYCDSSFVNSTDIEAYLPKSGGTMTGNITMDANQCIVFDNGASICGI